jgi:hypothetical protein
LTLLVLVILAALWAVVLLPPLLRSRTGRANDSIGDFNYRLDVLGRTNGALQPESSPRVASAGGAAKRRRDVLRVLVSAVVVTGLLGLATNAPLLWAIHVGADLALLGFFGLWVYSRSVQAEATKVHRLNARRPADLPLRRAASS